MEEEQLENGAWTVRWIFSSLVPFSSVQFSSDQFCSVQFRPVWFSSVQSRLVQFSSVQFSSRLFTFAFSQIVPPTKTNEVNNITNAQTQASNCKDRRRMITVFQNSEGSCFVCITRVLGQTSGLCAWQLYLDRPVACVHDTCAQTDIWLVCITPVLGQACSLRAWHLYCTNETLRKKKSKEQANTLTFNVTQKKKKKKKKKERAEESKPVN